jgi:hypothetical protein
MNTFRALCAELLQSLAEYDGANPYHDHRDLITRASAELAKPEPVGPTRDELRTMAAEFAARTPEEFALAVLARWGRPAVTPIPVSEESPKPDDLDNNRSTDIKDGAAFQSKRICAIVDHTADHLHEIIEIGEIDPALLVFGRIILRRLSQVVKDLPDFEISFDESESTQ